MTLTDKIHKRLRPYAKERGLLRKGRTYYTITEDTAYCFSIENHTFDVYVHFYLIPLYMREENHILTYGNLLNSLFFKKNTHIAENSCGGRNRCLGGNRHRHRG